METDHLSFVDTHCHLYVPEFNTDQDEMVQRAISSGVVKCFLPNIDADSVQPMLDLCNRFPDMCYPMIGLHPTSVKENFKEHLDLLNAYLANESVIGIGETGVDLYWDTTFRKEQIEAFEHQIDWAKSYGLPVIIHSRESLDLNIEIIRNQQDGNLRGIFHCFTGTREQAMQIYELGFKAGIGGVITYKNSDLGEVVKTLPHELFVLETDSPYLTPVPHRGKRNEPAYLRFVADRLAEALQLSLADIARMTGINVEMVFGKLD
jgi:TatD DNase family protein